MDLSVCLGYAQVRLIRLNLHDLDDKHIFDNRGMMIFLLFTLTLSNAVGGDETETKLFL